MTKDSSGPENPVQMPMCHSALATHKLATPASARVSSARLCRVGRSQRTSYQAGATCQSALATWFLSRAPLYSLTTSLWYSASSQAWQSAPLCSYYPLCCIWLPAAKRTRNMSAPRKVALSVRGQWSVRVVGCSRASASVFSWWWESPTFASRTTILWSRFSGECFQSLFCLS